MIDFHGTFIYNVYKINIIQPEVSMPIKIPDALPARSILENENIFVMSEARASTQDIRPLRILILNLMPTKITTETQLLRALSNTPLQIEFDLLKTATHRSKNTSSEHLDSFYKDFSDIKNKKYDGMIITGAPVETLEFESVDYWPELCEIMEWTKTNVFSTFHICWGSQAALYYHYGIGKSQTDSKVFGIFRHENLNPKCPLLRGFDDIFYAPHSRHTAIDEAALSDCEKLEKVVLPESIASIDGRAFADSHNLTRVTLKAPTPPVLKTSSYIPATCIFEVPAESLAVYKAASEWSNIANQIIAIEE